MLTYLAEYKGEKHRLPSFGFIRKIETILCRDLSQARRLLETMEGEEVILEEGRDCVAIVRTFLIQDKEG